MPMKHLFTFLVPILLIASGCNKGEDFSNTQNNYGQLALELKQSPQEIALGNSRLILLADVYRRTEVGGDGATVCTQTLKDKAGLPIDTTIVLKQQYWIRNDDVWQSPYKSVNISWRQITSTTEEAPRWPVDLYVDPVCEFEYQGKTYRLLGQPALVRGLQ